MARSPEYTQRFLEHHASTGTLHCEGVREYAEEFPVVVEQARPGGTGGARWVVVAWNEGGYNLTQVDLEDLLGWLRANREKLPEGIGKFFKHGTPPENLGA